MEFIRIARDDFDAPAFLADRQVSPSDRLTVSWENVEAYGAETSRICFIFHTAFCRSTLLVRALDNPGSALGLSEPGIIASIVNARGAADHLIRPLVALLARPHANEAVAFIKPTNHANRLMPALLGALPGSRAILMTNSLPQFLRAVARKGLMGRRWGRQLLLEMQSYAGVDLGMDARETFCMTDMQAAGIAWFLAQRWFALHLAGQVRNVSKDRLSVLDGDRFDGERARTLKAANAFAGARISEEDAIARANSPLFASHAKSGVVYAGDNTSSDPRFEEELEQVGQWIGAIIEQSGLDLPLRHELF
ncbi:hypothetical protein [Erythrobacter litoralis]|uniref:hypothetical protein n=1 Tax=Erythrobacter litoralis TaxID=39960 RepID=UPI0024351565|nr:hypothetical protein [Erythrobacter litoralis]